MKKVGITHSVIILRSAPLKAERMVLQTSTLKDRNLTARCQPGLFFHWPSSWVIVKVSQILNNNSYNNDSVWSYIYQWPFTDLNFCGSGTPECISSPPSLVFTRKEQAQGIWQIHIWSLWCLSLTSDGNIPEAPWTFIQITFMVFLMSIRTITFSIKWN